MAVHSLFGGHHLDELLIVDLSITINVSLADHLINLKNVKIDAQKSIKRYLLIGKLLAKVGHDMSELSSADEAIAVLIENAESLTDLLLAVGILHLTGHHGEELREIDSSVSISIHFVNHVLWAK